MKCLICLRELIEGKCPNPRCHEGDIARCTKCGESNPLMDSPYCPPCLVDYWIAKETKGYAR